MNKTTLTSNATLTSKELNYYKGKKGYSDIIALPAPGTEGRPVNLNMTLNILESYDNLCFAEATNIGMNYTEYHIYSIGEDDIAVRTDYKVSYYDKDGVMRRVGSFDDVKDLYDKTVEKIRREYQTAMLNAQGDAERAKQAKLDADIKAKQLSIKAMKIADLTTVKDEAEERLAVLIQSNDVKDLLKDKKVNELKTKISTCELILKYLN